MRSEFKLVDIPACAKRLMQLLEKAEYDAYVVGGCVRDSILDFMPNDWDICTNAKPEVVCELLRNWGIRVIETGLQHGTVTAHYGVNSYEITTFRIDGEYSDNRRPDRVEFVGDIIEDLGRRDFTINAMAYNDTYGLVDPWNGSCDLNLGLIRCVRNPDDRFREDALRIMRALRFAATYGFRIEEKTAAAIHRNKDLLKNISAERIQSELCKMLCGDGVLNVLLEYKDVMAVIIPELEPCIGFEQNNPYHIYDVYDHIAHAVASDKGNDISIKMALLLHDIGKPECYSVDTIDGVTGHFYGHAVPSARIAKDVMDRFKFDNKTKAEVVDLVSCHDAFIRPSFKAVKRWMNKIGHDLFEKFLSVRLADISAQSTINQASRIDKCYKISDIANTIVAQHQCCSLKDLMINGYAIMELDVESGPIIGKVLNHLLDRVIDGSIPNDFDALFEEAKRYLKGE